MPQPGSALMSPYVVTAFRKATPTIGPVAMTMSHQARDAVSPRHSLANSQAAGRLRPRVSAARAAFARGRRRARAAAQVSARNTSEIGCHRAGTGARRQLRRGPLAADAAAAQQNEAIADAGGVDDLVDGQDERASGGGAAAQRVADVAGLAQVEAVERLVADDHRLRRQERDREQRPLPLPLRQGADGRVEDRRQVEILYDAVDVAGAPAEETDREVKSPSDRLRRPRGDGVGQVEEVPVALASEGDAVRVDAAGVTGDQPREALQQRRLARPVGSDNAEHFAGAEGKGDTVECSQPAVTFRQTGGGKAHR